MALLDVHDLSINFGGLQAVTDFNLSLNERDLVGLIGPNGAGKTTVFNMLSGVYRPTRGSILFEGHELAGLKPYNVSALGVARTFQNIRLFRELTVLQNVRIAHHSFAEHNLADSLFRTMRYSQSERRLTEEALSFLSVFGLQESADELAKNLPYGQQRRLEIARALATKPKLLLLDEPAAGMNPQETQNLMRLIQFIREQFNLTILLIEHQMRVVMGICKHILVMDFGQVIARGDPNTIQKDPAVIAAYLGRQAGRHAAN